MNLWTITINHFNDEFGPIKSFGFREMFTFLLHKFHVECVGLYSVNHYYGWWRCQCTRIGNSFVFIIQQTAENVGLIAWKEVKSRAIIPRRRSSTIIIIIIFGQNLQLKRHWLNRFATEIQHILFSMFSFRFVDEAPL